MSTCRALRIAGLLLFGLIGAPLGWGQDPLPVPPLKARVTDLTSTLTPDQAQQLEQRIADFEARKGSQIAVLIAPTTQPEAIEAYSIRVAEQWKLGRKGVDDGALLLVAKNDRALRIEVGYGLEGAMPDITANRIVEDIIVPRFRSGDFYGGIDAGVGAMIKVIDGEPLPAPEKSRQTQSRVRGLDPSWLVIGMLLVVVVGGIFRAMFGRFPAAGLIGGGAGVIAWFLIGSLVLAAIAGLIAFFFTLLAGTSGLPGTGRRGVGGWPGGGWGSGGGGFGGGGGFSGGGGGFGGGGASGRW